MYDKKSLAFLKSHGQKLIKTKNDIIFYAGGAGHSSEPKINIGNSEEAMVISVPCAEANNVSEEGENDDLQ